MEDSASCIYLTLTPSSKLIKWIWVACKLTGLVGNWNQIILKWNVQVPSVAGICFRFLLLVLPLKKPESGPIHQSQIIVENQSLVRLTPQSGLNTPWAAVCQNDPGLQTDVPSQLQWVSVQIPNKHYVMFFSAVFRCVQMQATWTDSTPAPGCLFLQKQNDCRHLWTSDKWCPGSDDWGQTAAYLWTPGPITYEHLQWLHQKYDEWEGSWSETYCKPQNIKVSFYIQYLTM